MGLHPPSKTENSAFALQWLNSPNERGERLRVHSAVSVDRSRTFSPGRNR